MGSAAARSRRIADQGEAMSKDQVSEETIERVSGPTLFIESVEVERVQSAGLVTANVRHVGREAVNPETLEGEPRPVPRRRARR
jgi:hypothetical protein